MYYLFHSKTSDSKKECDSEISELSKNGSIYSYKNACFDNENETSKLRNSDVEERNASGNQAIT